MRLALGIEYDGSHYHGWQKQPGLKTVQGVLEKALSKIASTDISITCCGRTDTGVHALNQVIHFDCDVERSLRAWVFGVNSQLPKDISVRWSKEVSEDFHARYKALTRYYRYAIFNHAIRPANMRGHITWQYRALDVELMNQAARLLIGEHDFTSFRSTECQAKSPVREIKHIEVTRVGDLVYIDVKANAFLHHMVRNIAGVLMAVGSSRQTVSWVEDVLAKKNRAMAAETAPPYGLYLVDVEYPQEFDIPKSQMLPFFQ